jgi:hypothetical protein
MSGSYVLEMTPEELSSGTGDLDFQSRVLADVVHVGAIRGTLTVAEAEDGTPSLSWSETTEEGGRSVSATFYTSDECSENHTTTRRDHQAEAAGY